MIHKIYHFIVFLYLKRKFKQIYFDDTVRISRMMTPGCVKLGHNVVIQFNARIQGVKVYNSKSYNPEIIIHDGVHIQQNLHLTCASRVEIGKNTAIAANVTITDINHRYEDVNMPVDKQDIDVNEVIIGEDCKIYNGAVILPGVHLGRHVVVGANSVVLKDVPSYSVVAGNPARIVKKYNESKKEWEKVLKQ